MKLVYSLSLIIIAIVGILISFSFGISGDEIDMNMLGKSTLDYLTTFGKDQTIFNLPKEFDRDGVMKYYGGAFEIIANIISKISPENTYSIRHILIFLSALASIFLASKICIKVSGYIAGIICVWFMFFYPFFIGNAMNNSKDIPFAFAYILSIYSILRFGEKESKYQWKDYLLLILPIAFAINIRIAGLILIGYLPVYFFLKLFLEKRLSEIKQYVLPIIIVSLGSYFLSSIIWPFGLQNPLMNPIEALNAFSNFKVSINQLYEGKKIMSSELPRFFVLKAIYLTSTIAFILGVLFSILFIIKNKSKQIQLICLFIAFTVVFPISFLIYSKSNIYHLWRHSLFIFPSISILIALGWDYMIISQKNKFIKIGIATLFAICLLEPMYFMAKNFPHFITYFNPLTGGFEKNYGYYETDFYYNSLKQSSDWFIKNEYPKYPKDKDIVIASNAAHILKEYFKPYKNVKINYVRYNERDGQEYDYSLFHISLVPVGSYVNNSWINKDVIYNSGIGDKFFNLLIKKNNKNDFYAKKLIDSNKFAEAIPYLNKALQYDPNNEIAWTNLGFCQLNTNQAGQALESLKKAITISPENMSAKNFLGYAYLQTGNTNYAQYVFLEMIEQNPNNPEPYKILSQIYQQQGNTQAAQQYSNAYQQIMTAMGR